MSFYTDVLRPLGLVLAGVFIVWIAFALTQETASYERALGWITLPLASFAMLMGVAQLFRRKPTVVISDTGILDRRLFVGEIAWNDIASIEMVQNHRTRYLRLKLHDPPDYFERMPLLVGILSGAIFAIGLSPFRIVFVGLEPGIDEAYSLVVEKVARFDA